MRPPQIYFDFIRPFQHLYYFIARPRTYGVKILLKNGNKFLLLRNTYGLKHWTFPGGHIENNETPKQAAIRETLEETGILISKPTQIGIYKSNRYYKRDTVYCYYCQINQSKVLHDPREILETKWIDINNLPSPRSFAVDEVVNLYKKFLNSR